MATTRARGQKAPDPVNLTPLERELLLEEVREAFQAERIYWEAVRAGVALGAQEVQDQRLAAAEQPPKQMAEFDLLILGLVFLLESPVAVPIAAAVITRPIAVLIRRQMAARARAFAYARTQQAAASQAALVRARAIAESRGLRADRRTATFEKVGGSGWEKRAKEAQERAEQARDAVTEALRKENGDRLMAVLGRKAYRATLPAARIARDPDLAGYAVAALKTSLQAAQQSQHTATYEGAVSPGVTLRGQVEHQALATIEESYRTQALYERFVRTQVFTDEQAVEVYADLGPLAYVDIAAVLAHNQLLAAGLIWRTILNAQGAGDERMAEVDTRLRPMTGRTVNGIAPGSRQSSKLMGELRNVPEVHKKYLMTRFGAVAEAWARIAPHEVHPPDSFVDNFKSSKHHELVSRYLSTSNEDTEVRLDLIMLWLDALGTLQNPV